MTSIQTLHDVLIAIAVTVGIAVAVSLALAAAAVLFEREQARAARTGPAAPAGQRPAHQVTRELVGR